MALLDNSFAIAVDARVETDDEVASIRRKQFTGFAGIAAYRLARALELPATEDAALRLLALHPALNPAAYVSLEVHDDGITVRHSPAHQDQAWISLCGPEWLDGLRALVRVLDPHFDVEAERIDPDSWRMQVVRRSEPAPEAQVEVPAVAAPLALIVARQHGGPGAGSAAAAITECGDAASLGPARRGGNGRDRNGGEERQDDDLDKDQVSDE